VDAAAAAAAAGGAYPQEAAALGGRRFALRLPFGCAGPTPEAASGWSYDAGRQALKITVRPETWTDAPWARELAGTPETELIDGFWLRRPWMTTEACPAPAVAAPGAAPAEETVALVRVFEAGSSRVTRRGGRAYEVTEKVPPEPPPGEGGFRLVLEGRIAAPEDGRPIRCRSLHPDRRPLCLVLVDVDRVAFEAAGGRQFAEWSR
uniref:hypothetical protein n=1 Tax=Phenylobacterium sp. TaxID=1871053 RepID=UPI0035B48C5A